MFFHTKKDMNLLSWIPKIIIYLRRFAEYIFGLDAMLALLFELIWFDLREK